MTTATTSAPTHVPDIALQPFVLDQHRIMVGDLVIDLALRTIHSRSLKTVKLSGNEFVILATLTKFASQYVARDDLLQAVAGPDFAGDDGLVDVYIRYVIRRLTEADTSATIQKATGVGYRLIP